MKTNVLEKLGLTQNEIKIYTELLKRGTSTTGPIIDTLNISGSRTYASLQQLIEKGLVTYFMKNNTRYYQAESPDLLLDYIDEIKTQAQPFIKELKTIKQPSEEKESSAIFEGFNGFKQAFDILLNETSKHDEIYTIGFSSPPRIETLRTHLKKVDMQRIRKKTKMKILLDVSVKETIGKDRASEPYTEVRYLPKGYITPAALSIFKNYVIHWVWAEKTTAFLIKSNDVSESFKNYFQLLWKTAKN